MRKNVKVTVVVAVAIVVAVWFGGSAKWAGLFMKHQIQGRQVRLFCQTDHRALLAGCRELSRRVATGELQAGVYRVDSFPEADTLRLPQAIRALEPRDIIVSEDGPVKLSMYSGWRPFGVWACPEGTNRDGPW